MLRHRYSISFNKLSCICFCIGGADCKFMQLHQTLGMFNQCCRHMDTLSTVQQLQIIKVSSKFDPHCKVPDQGLVVIHRGGHLLHGALGHKIRLPFLLPTSFAKYNVPNPRPRRNVFERQYMGDQCVRLIQPSIRATRKSNLQIGFWRACNVYLSTRSFTQANTQMRYASAS